MQDNRMGKNFVFQLNKCIQNSKKEGIQKHLMNVGQGAKHCVI